VPVAHCPGSKENEAMDMTTLFTMALGAGPRGRRSSSSSGSTWSSRRRRGDLLGLVAEGLEEAIPGFKPMLVIHGGGHHVPAHHQDF